MDQPQQDGSQVSNDGVVEDAVNQEPVVETTPNSEGVTAVPITIVSASDDSAAPEAQLPEAPAATGADELASVASELEALSAQSDTPMVDEGLPSSSNDVSNQEVTPMESTGTDPMEQIQAEEQSSSSETNVFASGEQVNEMDLVTAAPAEEAHSSTIEGNPTEPVSDALAVEPLASAGPVGGTEGASNAEAVSMANQATLEQEPTRNPGDLINDVIAPTAVATAVAEGTSGANAITGTPETSSVESAQTAAAAPKPYKQKSKKGILILVVVLVVLLFGGAAVAAYLMQPKKDSTSSSSANKESTDSSAKSDLVAGANASTTPAPGETVTAKALDDYKVACGGGMVTNATEYKGAGPHPVVFFEKGSDDKYAMSVVAFKDKTWAADAAKVASGQLAVCVSEKVATEKKVKTCPLTDVTTKVTTNVDYYTATYAVDVYNARTGAKVNSYEAPSIVTDCPTTASYDKTNPKLIAKYDLVSVETAIKTDVTKVL